MDTLVLGAGVCGLSSAIRLTEEGHQVTLWAAERTPNTTSDVAAAVHYPFPAEPRDKLIAWSQRSLEVFGELEDEPEAGVHMGELLEVFDDQAPEPWWADAVASVRPAAQAELPHGYGSGLISQVPFVDMAAYMPYLEERAFGALDVGFEERRVEDLAEIEDDWDAVVNCTGMGARELLDDDELVPVRGQLVYVEAPGLQRAYVDQQRDEQLAYVVPLEDRVVLGGTMQAGEEDTAPSEHVTDVILARCRRLVPELAGAKVLDVKVGLRPHRDVVRVEREELDDGQVVVHNYGHGGAGVTLAWGCAEEVVGLVPG